MKRLAAILAVAVAAVAVVGVVLIIAGGDEDGPTAQEVRQRVLTRWSIGGRHPASASCRAAKKEDYFDCKVLFGRKEEGEAVFGYEIQVPGSAPEQQAKPWFSNELSRWGGATTTFNAVLERCVRQPNAVPGFMSACTGKDLLGYRRATARLQLLLAMKPTQRECARGLEQAKSLAAEVTLAFTKVLQVATANLDDASEGRSRRAAKPLIGLVGKANRVTRRNVKSYDQIATSLRKVCA